MVSEQTIRKFTERAGSLGARVFQFTNLSEAENFLSKFFKERDIKSVLVQKKLEKNFPALNQIFQPPVLDFAEAEKAQAGFMLADFGIADTGTIVQFYENDLEKLPGILPLVCLSLVFSEKIVESAEAISGFISRHLAQGKQVALISGPSRTADIECKQEIGVHGPAELIIILIEGKSD